MGSDATNIRTEKVGSTGGTVVLVMYDEDAMTPGEAAQLIASYQDDGYVYRGIIPVGGDEDFGLVFTTDHARRPLLPRERGTHGRS